MDLKKVRARIANLSNTNSIFPKFVVSPDGKSISLYTENEPTSVGEGELFLEPLAAVPQNEPYLIVTESEDSTIVMRVEPIPPIPLPESEHPYPDNADETQTYELDKTNGPVKITFDNQTFVQSDYSTTPSSNIHDRIFIYDAHGNPIEGMPTQGYTGEMLWNRSVQLPTEGFSVRLVSGPVKTLWNGTEVPNVYYGYKVEEIDDEDTDVSDTIPTSGWVTGTGAEYDYSFRHDLVSLSPEESNYVVENVIDLFKYQPDTTTYENYQGHDYIPYWTVKNGVLDYIEAADSWRSSAIELGTNVIQRHWGGSDPVAFATKRDGSGLSWIPRHPETGVHGGGTPFEIAVKDVAFGLWSDGSIKYVYALNTLTGYIEALEQIPELDPSKMGSITNMYLMGEDTDNYYIFGFDFTSYVERYKHPPTHITYNKTSKTFSITTMDKQMYALAYEETAWTGIQNAHIDYTNKHFYFGNYNGLAKTDFQGNVIWGRNTSYLEPEYTATSITSGLTPTPSAEYEVLDTQYNTSSDYRFYFKIDRSGTFYEYVKQSDSVITHPNAYPSGATVKDMASSNTNNPIIATNNGIYVYNKTTDTYTARNNGLTGDASRVNEISIFNNQAIATNDGVWVDTNYGTSGWTRLGTALNGKEIVSVSWDKQGGIFAVEKGSNVLWWYKNGATEWANFADDPFFPAGEPKFNGQDSTPINNHPPTDQEWTKVFDFLTYSLGAYAYIHTKNQVYFVAIGPDGNVRRFYFYDDATHKVMPSGTVAGLQADASNLNAYDPILKTTDGIYTGDIAWVPVSDAVTGHTGVPKQVSFRHYYLVTTTGIFKTASISRTDFSETIWLLESPTTGHLYTWGGTYNDAQSRWEMSALEIDKNTGDLLNIYPFDPTNDYHSQAVMSSSGKIYVINEYGDFAHLVDTATGSVQSIDVVAAIGRRLSPSFGQHGFIDSEDKWWLFAFGDNDSLMCITADAQIHYLDVDAYDPETNTYLEDYYSIIPLRDGSIMYLNNGWDKLKKIKAVF